MAFGIYRPRLNRISNILFVSVGMWVVGFIGLCKIHGICLGKGKYGMVYV